MNSMGTRFQHILLATYNLVVNTGLMRHTWAQNVFMGSYNLYKRVFEARFIQHLAASIQPHSCVIDVGANIGHFTVKFGNWVSGNGRVIAIEPESQNLNLLNANIARHKLAAKVQIVAAMASDHNGNGYLYVDKNHPGNHHLALEGMPVRTITIDDLLTDIACQGVSLIKIDVQGAESLVIAGASQTIARFHPDLFVEIDDAALQELGSSAEKLLSSIVRMGYTIHQLGSNGILPAIEMSTALRIAVSQEYTDFLFRSMSAHHS
jgi:FkbM family methyltransferase